MFECAEFFEEPFLHAAPKKWAEDEGGELCAQAVGARLDRVGDFGAGIDLDEGNASIELKGSAPGSSAEGCRRFVGHHLKLDGVGPPILPILGYKARPHSNVVRDHSGGSDAGYPFRHVGDVRHEGKNCRPLVRNGD